MFRKIISRLLPLVLLGVPAAGLLIAPQTVQAAIPAGSGRFVPVTPSRVLDTRTGNGAPAVKLSANGSLAVQISGRGGVPGTNVTAVAVNITAVDAAAVGYITAWPSNVGMPEASTLNYNPGDNIANMAILPIAADTGKLSLFTSASVHLLVDVTGYWEKTTTATASGRFVPLTPRRVLDTRSNGMGSQAGDAVLSQQIRGANGIPADASAVVATLTSVDPKRSGYLTMWPSGTGRPDTSNLNLNAGSVRANSVIIPIGSNGKVDIYTYSGGHVILDITGYFTGAQSYVSDTGLFVPVTPYRMMDTRKKESGSYRVYANQTVTLTVGGRAGVPFNAAGIAGNYTAVNVAGWSYATLWPSGVPQPTTSTVNAGVAGQNVAAGVVSGLGSGRIVMTPSADMDMIFDATGYFTPSGPLSTATITNNYIVMSAPPAITYPLGTNFGGIQIPSIGVNSTIIEGTDDSIYNRGVTGHWPGTQSACRRGNMVLGAHRTSAGGLFLNVHLLRAGDKIVVNGCTYTVTSWEVVPVEQIGTMFPAPDDRAWVTLFACSEPDGSPTSLLHRIIVRGVMTP